MVEIWCKCTGVFDSPRVDQEGGNQQEERVEFRRACSRLKRIEKLASAVRRVNHATKTSTGMVFLSLSARGKGTSGRGLSLEARPRKVTESDTDLSVIRMCCDALAVPHLHPQRLDLPCVWAGWNLVRWQFSPGRCFEDRDSASTLDWRSSAPALGPWHHHQEVLPLVTQGHSDEHLTRRRVAVCADS